MEIYTKTNQIFIAAKPAEVYRIAADPEKVPEYENGILKIEIDSFSKNVALGRSTLSLGFFSITSNYKFHYSAPGFYSGEQIDGRLVNAFFTLSFSEEADGTRVKHVEGLKSNLPFIARLLAFIFLSESKIAKELLRLKTLVET